jgi:gliding motility-associated lipoprotein GldH
LYHSYQPVTDTGWYSNDTLLYQLPFPISAQESLQYEIGIRHKDTYPYRDLWLTVNQDTIHMYLADTTGYWLGNGIGNIKQYSNTFQPQMGTRDSIKELRVTHIMQDNPLHGICDIGIHIKHPQP